MSNLLQLHQGVKSFGSKLLFDQAGFAVNEGEHIGVIGPNGAGKTTLFKILIGEQNLDSGSLIRARSLRLGYLAQHDEWHDGDSVEQFLSRSSVLPIWDLKALGRDLGLDEAIFQRQIASLSGGYRMRCKLLFLIGQDPNLMLLDEPTNYLDLETTIVLEKFLQSYRGAFLLISHDREFLRRTTDHTLEVEAGDMVKFNGNIDDYFEQKSMLRTQLESRALSIQEKRSEVMAFVNRFGASASKAKQAQSRLKSLDRMENIEIKPVPISARILIPSPLRVGKIVMQLKNACLGYPGKMILRSVELSIFQGDHIAIVGLNGAGKSTLLKALAGVLQPSEGSLEYGYQVNVGYYAQHVAEGLDPQMNVIDAMTSRSHPDVSWQECLNMAGSLLFSGDDIKKKISVLSGGEKSRVALGQILLSKAPCLVLDEPTNHLDFQTVEALTEALKTFIGTVVVVSHDRGFIRRVAGKILEVSHGQVQLYPGSYDEYVWSLQKGILAQDRAGDSTGTQTGSQTGKLSGSRTENRKNSDSPKDSTTGFQESGADQTSLKDQRKNLERVIKASEKKIIEWDQKISKLQSEIQKLNDQILTQSGPEARSLGQRLGELQIELDLAEAQWLEFAGEKETAESTLSALNGNLKT